MTQLKNSIRQRFALAKKASFRIMDDDLFARLLSVLSLRTNNEWLRILVLKFSCIVCSFDFHSRANGIIELANITPQFRYNVRAVRNHSHCVVSVVFEMVRFFSLMIFFN